MQHFFLRIILITFFGSISSGALAQKVFVANDFAACGVGLRDSSGKWLAEPIYQKIYDGYHGYYKMLYGSKEGVLDSTGKVVVPAIYDFAYIKTTLVDSHRVILFVVGNDKYEGLVNTSNQLLIPIVCRMISVEEDGNIIVEKAKKHYSIYNVKGEESVIPKKLPQAPHYLGNHMYEVARNCFGITIRRKYYRHHGKRRLKNIFRRTISLKHKYGMMNDSLRLIIPKKFSDVSYSPGKYKLVNVSKGRKSGYYDLNGKEIWAPIFKEEYSFKTGYYSFDYERVPMINSEGYTKVQLGKKYGLIKANGDTILPFVYDEIYMINSRGVDNPNAKWIVEKNNKRGIFDPASGKWVLPMEYSKLSTVTSYYYPADSTTPKLNNRNPYNYRSYNQQAIEMSLLIAQKNGKYGMLTSAGQEILPFIYEEYEYEYGSYFFKSGNSYVTVTTPVYQDTAIRRYFYYGETKTYVVSTCPKTHQFEKITRPDGTILFIDQSLLKDTAQLKLYNYQKEGLIINPETYNNYLHATAIVIKPLTQSRIFPGIGPVYTFQNPDFNYQKSDSEKTFCIDTVYWKKIRTVFTMAEDSFHTYSFVYGKSGIYREDGFVLAKPKSYKYCDDIGISNGLALFKLDCGRNKVGIIDGNGKLLIDTAYGALNGLRGNHIWAVKKEHRFFYYRYYYDWNILDTTTHQLLLPKKQCSSRTYELGNNAAIIQREDGLKLFNMSTQQYILKSGVNDFFKMDSAGNYFAVRTCWGHIGIVDGNGKWLTDTIWTALIHASDKDQGFEYSYYRDAGYRSSHPYDLCVLSNDTGWTIFNGYKGTVSHDMESARYLLRTSKNSFDNDSVRGMRKFCADCPSYAIENESAQTKPMAVWQEILLFDSLFTGETFVPDTLHSWFVATCDDCRKRNPKETFQYSWSKNYDKETLNHTITFINDSCISVSRQVLSGYFRVKNYSSDLFFTVMLFSDGPHTMLLDSLFTGSEWKKVMADEVSLYFESHPNIEGNCHNPFMLPMMMRDRFVITATGIALYPPNYKENEHQLSMILPWEKFKPYLRKDVASKLGLN